MRRGSMATRDELVAVVIERYSKGRRAEKGRILDEFAAVTGFHRKHAMRVLRGGQAKRCSAPRPERRLYDEAVREALIVLWEASDRVCGKRLKALAPILVVARQLGREDLARAGINGQMKLTPGPLAARTVLLHQPLAGAVDLQTR